MPATKATETAVSSAAGTKTAIGSRGKKMAMIKSIKIVAENAGAIELALRAENGCATAHTYTTFSEIESLAVRAEEKMEDLGIPKSARAGATYERASGGSVAKSYKSTRVITLVQLQRKSADWYLVAVGVATVWPSGYSGKTGLTLTAEQDARAVAVLRENYHVAA